MKDFDEDIERMHDIMDELIEGNKVEWGHIWDQTCEMARTMSGYDENGQSMFTDEEWIQEYTKSFMSREDFVTKKEAEFRRKNQ